jgi:hypothetical protein
LTSMNGETLKLMCSPWQCRVTLVIDSDGESHCHRSSCKLDHFINHSIGEVKYGIDVDNVLRGLDICHRPRRVSHTDQGLSQNLEPFHIVNGTRGVLAADCRNVHNRESLQRIKPAMPASSLSACPLRTSCSASSAINATSKTWSGISDFIFSTASSWPPSDRALRRRHSA